MNEGQLQKNIIDENVSSESEIRSDYEIVSKKNKLSPLIIYIVSGVIFISVVSFLIYFFFFVN